MSTIAPDELIRAYPEIDFLVAEGAVSSRYMVAIHRAFYEFAAERADGAVLDAGCGTGFGTGVLATLSQRAVGIDSKGLLIRYGRQNYRRPNLAFGVMDATTLGFSDDAFDTVVADELVEHLPEHRPFLEETVRVLKADGQFICATVNRIHSLGSGAEPLNRNHFREYDREEFRAELLSYFHEVELFGQGTGGAFRRYWKSRSARGIEWLLLKLNVKHRIPAGWRSRVRSRITGVAVDRIEDEEFEVNDRDVENALYLVAVARRPRRR